MGFYLSLEKLHLMMPSFHLSLPIFQYQFKEHLAKLVSRMSVYSLQFADSAI